MLGCARLPFRVAAAVLGALLWISCSSGPATPQRPAGSERSGRASSAGLERLEQQVRSRPRDIQARLALADGYYTLARKELDAGRSEQYVRYLGLAQEVVLEAIRIDPMSPEPHTTMGIITAYQGDLDAASGSFKNALRLARRVRDRSRLGPRGISGTMFSNIAHIAVYRGNLTEARLYLDRARIAGAPTDELDRIAVLAAWKGNDMTEAREAFDIALRTSTPDFSRAWDQVELPTPMRTFDDFADVCCRNPTCGPHMANACKAASKVVKEREITREVLVKEMELERERRRKLAEIYRNKGLQIEVEGDPAQAGTASRAEPGAELPAPPRPRPAR